MKFSVYDYEKHFRNLISSLSEVGFKDSEPRIEVGPLGIQSGAHRLAACLALRISPNLVQQEDYQNSNYNYSGLLKSGMSKNAIEYMVWRFVQLKPQARVLVINNVDRHTFKKLLGGLRATLQARELYASQMQLTEVGKRRLIQHCYDHLDWWQDSLLERFVAERYIGKQLDTYFVIYIADYQGQELELKQHLRGLVSAQVAFDRQIHGSDDHFETMKIVETLLNKNSRQFLNLSAIGAEYRIMDKLSQSGFKSDYTANQDWSIDGGSVLELFGIRPARDLDYVAESKIHKRNPKIDFHNEAYSDGPYSPSDIIRDPRNHMRIGGVKFISLGSFVNLIISRGDVKSQRDISLVSSFLASQRIVYSDRPVGRGPRYWEFRVRVGRRLEWILNRLPRKIEEPLRRILRSIGKIIWQDL